MSSAPRLADIIASRPHVFDGMLDPGLMQEIPTRAYLSDRLSSFVGAARHYEEVLVTKVHPEILLGQQLPGIRA